LVFKHEFIILLTCRRTCVYHTAHLSHLRSSHCSLVVAPAFIIMLTCRRTCVHHTAHLSSHLRSPHCTLVVAHAFIILILVYCSLDLQTWVHLTSHLIFRPGFIILLSWPLVPSSSYCVLDL
jgi:hypothetical protein